MGGHRRRAPEPVDSPGTFLQRISRKGLSREDLLDLAYETFLDPVARVSQPGLSTAVPMLRAQLAQFHRTAKFELPEGFVPDSPGDIREIRLRKSQQGVIRDLRAAVLGAIGTMAYARAHMNRLVAQARDGSASLSSHPDFRTIAEALDRPSSVLPGFGRDYWQSRSIVRPYPSPYHELMCDLLERRLYPAMASTLRALQDEPGGSALLGLAQDLQTEFAENLLWLRTHAGETRPAGEETLEGALCGLLTENSASSLHVLTAWHEALLRLHGSMESLDPENYNARERRLRRQLLEAALSTDFLLHRSTLINLPTLFEAPASLAYPKFVDIFGPEPRGPNPVPSGLLQAAFVQNTWITAHWTVPGVRATPRSSRRNRCGGMIPVKGWNEPSLAAIRFNVRLLHGGGALPRNGPPPFPRISTVAMLARDLIDLAPRYLYGVFPWVKREPRRTVWDLRPWTDNFVQN